MEVEVGANNSNFMLSSTDLTEYNETNKNLSEASERTEKQKDSLIDLSISLSDTETAKLQEQQNNATENSSVFSLELESGAGLDALRQKQIELEAEYARLRTIQEESSGAIDLVDDSECTEQTEEHSRTQDETDLTSKSEKDENTMQHNTDESKFFKHSLFELGRRLWKSTQDAQHYTKGCLWSPDGTCILVPVHLDGMHVMELPQDLYQISDVSAQRTISKLTTAVHVQEGGTVYDVAWYPFMNSAVPESCCWLATRQHEPIHLFDAFNGELRCSYRGYDQVDEVEAAISVMFSNNGEKVLGGYKKTIKIFDTNVPGRDYDSVTVKKAVSCFALSTQNEETVTTGSWNGYIDHYDLRARQIGSLFTLGGHDGGITWLKYTKSEPIMLFSGARRDNKLLQWDMRNFREPLRTFERFVNTNQRIYFDLSPQEDWLISGDCNGLLRIFNLKELEPACTTVPIHKDCCNGVNFHPTLPIIATSAGQYHFMDVAADAPSPSDDTGRQIVKYENSVILLSISELQQPTP